MGGVWGGGVKTRRNVSKHQRLFKDLGHGLGSSVFVENSPSHNIRFIGNRSLNWPSLVLKYSNIKFMNPGHTLKSRPIIV